MVTEAYAFFLALFAAGAGALAAWVLTAVHYRGKIDKYKTFLARWYPLSFEGKRFDAKEARHGRGR